MKKYTDSQIDTCMETIYNNCNDSKFEWRGESLKNYANTPKTIYLIKYLNEMGYIICKEKDGQPNYIKLTPAGLSYFKMREDIETANTRSKKATIIGIAGVAIALASLGFEIVSRFLM